MTVRELIEKLQGMPQDMDVYYDDWEYGPSHINEVELGEPHYDGQKEVRLS